MPTSTPPTPVKRRADRHHAHRRGLYLALAYARAEPVDLVQLAPGLAHLAGESGDVTFEHGDDWWQKSDG